MADIIPGLIEPVLTMCCGHGDVVSYIFNPFFLVIYWWVYGSGMASWHYYNAVAIPYPQKVFISTNFR